VIWYLAVLAAAIAVLAVGAWALLRRSVNEAADATLHARLDGVTRFIEAVEKELPKEEVADEFHEYAALTPGDTLLEVVDSAGTVLVKPTANGWSELTTGVAASDAAPLAVDRSLQGRPYRILAGVVSAGGRAYRVIVALPMSAAHDALTRFGWWLTGLAPVVLLLAGAGGYWISRRALVPIEQLTRSVQDITVRNLDRRLDVPATDDELRRLAETFNGMLARLQAAVADMARLTAEASHELRTPVALVRATAEVALSRERPAEEYRQALADVQQEAERMSTLVDNLLALARADAGVDAQDTASVDLRAVASAAARTVEPAMARRSLQFDVETSDRPVTVTGSEDALRRLMLILLDNALRYTDPGGTVRLRTVPAGDAQATIEVVDNGLGIDPADRQRVFDRFYRGAAARARAADGAGLGLSIARAIVIRHGGTIALDPAPGGRGCVARVMLASVASVSSVSAP
jgi:heavy metal sensor kinase